MRIIAGSLGGRVLRTVEGPGYRPATAKVREAVFSMLASRDVVWGAVRVLDLFAGSGSLGFESLSRGARECCMVEIEADAAKCLRRNVDLLGLSEVCQIAEMDVRRFLRGRVHLPYDIMFIDPPYGKQLLSPTIKAVQQGGWLAPGGFVLAEIEAEVKYDPLKAAPWELQLDRLYGQTRILLWHNPNE